MKRSLVAVLSAFVLLNIFYFFGGATAQMSGMKDTGEKKMQMKMPMDQKAANRPEGQVTVKLSAHKQKLVGVKTAPVSMKMLQKVIHTMGRVDYNERHLATITTKIEGWIEELNIDATGMSVKKGEALFSVYSPKLVQTQEEYLLAIASAKKMKHKMGQGVMASASRRRLLLWDVKPEQIRQLEKRGEILRALPIFSSASGVVTEKTALAGMYVKPGMTLYKIADLSTVWVYVDIHEHELSLIKVGQNARVALTALPGISLEAQVSTIYPYLNENTRTATVRLELDNQDGNLKPGMYADVTFDILMTKALVVPESAVLDSGLRQVAFVAKSGGLFEPRVIKVGRRLNHEVEILEGLSQGEEVVTHGTFLIDSESKLMASMEGMMGLVGMGDWKMEGSKMGGMDMGGMKMDMEMGK